MIERRRFAFRMFPFSVLFLFLSAGVHGEVQNVGPDRTYDRIERAYKDASAGDTIRVCPKLNLPPFHGARKMDRAYRKTFFQYTPGAVQMWFTRTDGEIRFNCCQVAP